MQNRVTITVHGFRYNLLAPEGEEYVKQVAAYVDEKMAQMEEGQGERLAVVDNAILTALNIADERFKEKEQGENLRRQIKEILEEMAKLKQELSESKREVFRLQQKR